MRKSLLAAAGLVLCLGSGIGPTLAAITLPGTPDLFMQTSGPNRCASIGDWYTTDNLCGAAPASPDRVHRVWLDITQGMLDAGGGSVTLTVNDADNAGALDEVIGTSDPARFELRDEANQVLDSQDVSSAAPDGTPLSFLIATPGVYQIVAVSGAGPMFGDNTPDINNDDNTWSASLPDDGLVAQFQGTLQHGAAGTLSPTFFFVVGPGTGSLFLRNFDADGGIANLAYVSPGGSSVGGTVSANGTWNGPGAPNLNTGGDTLAGLSTAPGTGTDVGIWEIRLTSWTNTNQLILEANDGGGNRLPLFDISPSRAGRFSITPNGSLTTSAGVTVDHPFTVTNRFTTSDIINLSTGGTDPQYTVELLDANGDPLPDSDGDGDPDTGVLLTGEALNLILRVTPGPGAQGSDVTTVSAVSFLDELIGALDNVVLSVVKTTSIDTDGDGTADDIDLDDDNDGIPDVVEGPGDADGDGIPNAFDIDSDNDGITDLVEAGGTDGDGDGRVDGFTDANDDGLDDAIAASPLPVPDSDVDGRADYLDIDSDDDGITDNREAQTTAGYLAPASADADGDGLDDAYDASTGGTTLVPVNTDASDALDYLDDDSDNDGVPDHIEGHDADQDGLPDTVPAGSDADNDGLDDAYDSAPGSPDPTGSNAPLQDTDTDGERDWRDTDDDGDGLPTLGEDFDGNLDWSDDDQDGDGTPDYLDPDIPTDRDGDGVSDALDLDDDNDGIPDVVEGTGDADGDGIPNAFDLDSDNDGIPDLVEAGGTDGNGDGRVDGFTDANDDGLDDAIAASPLPVPDSDIDGRADYLDIDSDDDGITDNREAQTTAGYLAPASADADGDGLDDAYDASTDGTTLVPVNTDVSDALDYLDDDSDNDGVPDRIEGHDADQNDLPDTVPTGSDADNDGLDDAYDSAPGSPDPTGSNAPLQDTDTDGERDWRDTDDDGDGLPTLGEDFDGNLDWSDDDQDGDGTPDYLDPDIPTDRDGDGVSDALDLDDDNDGIPDLVEGTGDADGDGIPNAFDLDSDNDGIVDLIEAAGADTNGDGRVDGFTDANDDGLDDATAAAPLPVPDSDVDGRADYLDIDSDDDGITDNREAQTTAGYLAPASADADGDGFDDAYDASTGGTTLVPVNTDVSDALDYLDDDSDNDGVPDRIEGHDADQNGLPDTVPAGSDADNDGLDDAYDSAPGSPDPTGSNAPLQDTDTDGERDWRDADDDGDGLPTLGEDFDGNLDWSDDDQDGDGTPDYLDPDIPTDRDGDGVSDALDLDDDNDGIPDLVEGTGDADGDGIPNAFDLDSDNDGIPDVVEAGGTDGDGDGRVDGFTDANDDGLDDAIAASPLPVPDSDVDGRADYLDIDSDDDGITDNREAQTTAGYLAPAGADADGDGLDDAYDASTGGTTLVPVNTDASDALDYLDDDSDNDSVPDHIEGHDADQDGLPDTLPAGSDADNDGLDDAYDSAPGSPDPTGSNAPLQDTDTDGERDWRDTDDDGDGLPTLGEDFDGNLDWSDDDQDGDGTPDYLDPDIPTDRDGDGVSDALDLDDDNDGIPDLVEGTGDADGDGIPNAFDLDSDNDGIVDLIEAAGADTNGDGRVDGFTDANDDGLDDATAAAPLPVPDSDVDGRAEYLDIDSDADGITDNREAQTTAGYVPPSGVDGDNDGLDDAYDGDQAGTVLTPINTDGLGPADYRDRDSDQDGVPDSIEGHDADRDGVADRLPTGSDTDGDGLDDSFDSAPGSPEPTGSNAPLQDTDGDGERDWRDTDDDDDGLPTSSEDQNGNLDWSDDDANGNGRPDYLDAPDGDGDGVPNGSDIDDDGDGIPDAAESGDTDSDGVPDGLDIDSDDDGIPDVREAQSSGAYVPPSGLDGDGDGLDDAYDPDNGGIALAPIDTDGDTTPDYLDDDSDDDDVPDTIEGHDADHDGAADTLPAGSDTDGDGLDDAYDTLPGPDPTGTNAPLQNTDGTDEPDWRDLDDDNDGQPTLAEDGNGNLDWSDDDADGDGTPDYLDNGLPPGGAILLAKVAGVSETRIGGFVPYTVTAENITTSAIVGVSISDLIPAGFKLVRDSGRLVRGGTTSAVEPTGERPIVFANLDFAPGETLEIRYLLRVGTGVVAGGYKNVAVPSIGGSAIGNTASAGVEVRADDPILERTTVIGKVFHDVNRDGVQDAGERGIPGVRLATATGLLIETDSEGRYHLADVEGGRRERGANFILKADPASLPAGAEFTTENPRVLHLTQALMGKINFGVAFPADDPASPSRIELAGGGTVWLIEDPRAAEPRLDVTAPASVEVRDGSVRQPVRFELYSNYTAFIERWELALYAGDIDLELPVKSLGGPGLAAEAVWDGSVDRELALRSGDELTYVLKVFDAEGRADETAPARLQLTAAGPMTDAQQLVPPAHGENRQARRTIPVHGGRVRIQGSGVAPETVLSVGGRRVPVDASGRFVEEQVLPPGEHDIDVEVQQPATARERLDLPVVIDDHYFFMVGLADLTAGRNDISGSVEPVGADDHFDGDVYADGRVAFYLKGKIKGRYLLTGQLDTTEEELGDILSELDREDPRALVRRLDPDRYYPVYGDDSTTLSDVDTQGRFYLRLEWDDSQAVWGNYATGLTGTEFAQYDRSLYGAKVQHRSLAQTTDGEHRTEVIGFASQAQSAFAHDEFVGTGGSLYYLEHADVVGGSEKLRVEVRDRDSGRVLDNVTLERYRDYEIDEIQGRIILTRPLAQVADQIAPSIIKDTPLDGNAVLLLVDYEFVPDGFDPDNATYGLRAKGWAAERFGVGGSYVNESRAGADYELAGADFTYKAGRGTYLKAEYAESQATQAAASHASTDGGLSFSPIAIAAPADNREGDALALEGRVDFSEVGQGKLAGDAAAWWRERSAGFSTARTETPTETTEYGAEATWRASDRLSLSARAATIERDNVSDQRSYGVQADFRAAERLTVAAEARRVENEPTAGADSSGTLGAVRVGYDVTAQLNTYATAQVTLDRDDAYAENNLFTVGARCELNSRIGLTAEGSTGNRGEALRVGADYAANDRQRLYGTYTHSADRSDDGRGTFTLGRRSRISDQVSLFHESQFTHGERAASLAQVFGMDFMPSERWKAAFSLQSSHLDDPGSGGIERDAASVTLGHTGRRSRYSGKLEYRDDGGTVDRTQWLTTNRIDLHLSDGVTLNGKLGFSRTADHVADRNDGRFVESSVGVAYRPAQSDRLNLLGQYTFLYDLPAAGQSSSRTDQRSHVFSVEGLFDVSTRFGLGAKYALRDGELRDDRDAGLWFTSQVDLWVLQTRYHVIRDWDGVLEYRWLRADEAEDDKQGVLAILYRHLGEHVKAGVGYNFTDFSDDLTDLDYENNGWFVKLIGKM